MTAASAPDRALRKAVREAHRLGVVFRLVGDRVEIEGELPRDLREVLPEEQLRDYLGAAQIDARAIDFLAVLGASAIPVETIAGAEAAIADLRGAEVIGIDIETAPPHALPEPVRINADGKVAVRQPKPRGDGLDPYRADIQTLQLFGGTDKAFVFRGAALRHVMNSAWLRILLAKSPAGCVRPP